MSSKPTGFRKSALTKQGAFTPATKNSVISNPEPKKQPKAKK